MADESDVLNAMVSIAASSLGLGDAYLDGSLVLCPAAGVQCRVYRGWPTAGSLDADLAAGIVNVSVFPVPGATRNVTRHFLKWKRTATVVPTLTASVADNVVTFSGAGGIGQVAGVRFGPSLKGNAYAYRLIAQDNASTVAVALANRIPGASASGNDLILPSDVGVRALVVADQTKWMETRRQQQQVLVIGWCPNPASRDMVMSLIDAGFANMQDQFGRQNDQFALPDGSDATIIYTSSRTDDAPQQASLWRRDLKYRVEYPTTLVQQFPQMLFGGGHIYGQNSDAETTFGDLSPTAVQDSQTLVARGVVVVAAALAAVQQDNTIAASATH